MTYTVVENTPGYLPEDDDPATFEDLDEAVAYADGLARSIHDSYAEHGEPATWDRSSPTLWRIEPDDPSLLGRVVEIIDNGTDADGGMAEPFGRAQ